MRILFLPLAPPIRRHCPVKYSKGFRDSIILETALEHRAFRLLRRVEDRLRKDVMEGKTSAEAWNRALIEVSLSFLILWYCTSKNASDLCPD